MRSAVAEIMKAASDPETKRNFQETVEMQIGLKNYDTQRDKRFNGSIKYLQALIIYFVFS